MKKLVGALIIVIVLVLGGYYATGLVTEQTLKKDVELMNKSEGLFVEIKEYHRGWFDSNAELFWKLHIPEHVTKDQNGQPKMVPAQDYTLDMPLKIYHGPAMFAKDGVHFGFGYAVTELSLPPQLKEQLSEKFTEQSKLPQIKLSFLVNYLNRSRITLNLPEFSLIAKSGDGKLDWSGMTSSVTFNSSLDRVSGDMALAGVQIQNKEVTASLKDLSTEYDVHQTDNGLYLGQASISLPLMQVKSTDKELFELDKFYVHSDSGVDNGLFYSTLKISLDKIRGMDGKSYGPGLINMSIRNLDAESLAKMNNQINQMQNASDQEKQRAMLGLLPELPKLLSKGAEFKITELNFVLPEGRVEGALAVSLPEGGADNPFQMLEKVQGEAKLQLPQSIVKVALKESVKQQLVKEPTLQDALAEQMKQQAATPSESAGSDTDAAQQENTQGAEAQSEESVPAAQQQADQASTDGTASAQEKPVSSQMTLAELDQKAQKKVDEKLSALIAAGSLQQKGDDFIIHLTLKDGQLNVNGHPFNPAMIQF